MARPRKGIDILSHTHKGRPGQQIEKVQGNSRNESWQGCGTVERKRDERCGIPMVQVYGFLIYDISNLTTVKPGAKSWVLPISG
jgi:hypothetical protein